MTPRQVIHSPQTSSEGPQLDSEQDMRVEVNGSHANGVAGLCSKMRVFGSMGPTLVVFLNLDLSIKWLSENWVIG